MAVCGVVPVAAISAGIVGWRIPALTHIRTNHYCCYTTAVSALDCRSCGRWSVFGPSRIAAADTDIYEAARSELRWCLRLQRLASKIVHHLWAGFYLARRPDPTLTPPLWTLFGGLKIGTGGCAARPRVSVAFLYEKAGRKVSSDQSDNNSSSGGVARLVLERWCCNWGL